MQRARQQLWKKIVRLVCLPIAIESVFVIAFAIQLKQAQLEQSRYERSQLLLSRVHDGQQALAVSMSEMASIPIGRKWLPHIRTVSAAFKEVGDVIEHSGTVRFEISSILPTVRDWTEHASSFTAECERAIDSDTLPPAPTLTKLQHKLAAVMVESDSLASQLISVEQKFLVDSEKDLDTIKQQLLVLTLVGTISCLLASAFASHRFSRDVALRLRELRRTAELAAIGKLNAKPNEVRDEIDDLFTRLKAASELIQAAQHREFYILENARDVFCALDKNLRFVLCGESSLQTWHIHSTDLMGMSLLSLLKEDTVATTRAWFDKVTHDSNEHLIEMALRVAGSNDPHGNQLFKDFHWTVAYEENFEQFFCIARDISERKSLERMKQRFVAIVSHDLRTPLTAVSASITLLLSGKRGALTERAVEMLHKADKSIGRLLELTEDLLELERLESGKLTLSLGCVSAVDVCVAARDALLTLAATKQIDISVPSRDAALKGEERRLIQIMVNLVSNAIKFSPTGSRVRLTVEERDAVVIMSVIDEGPGMSEEQIKSLFEKYKQGSAKSELKGSGLGLALSKKLVEAHGGNMWVESAIGKGSRFAFSIPEFSTAMPHPKEQLR